jgi:hypothetical protein
LEKDAETEYYFALCFENGYGTAISYEKALRHFESSFSKGCKLASKKIENLKLVTSLKPVDRHTIFNQSQQKKLGHFTQSMNRFSDVGINTDSNSLRVNKLKRSENRGYLKTSRSSSQLSSLLSSQTNPKSHQSILVF